MVTLQSPALEVRIPLASMYLAVPVPDRVALQALALCLSWPSPPWEESARLEVQRANQEELESRQFLSVARAEEKAAARSGLYHARTALQVAQASLAALAFPLRDLLADGRLAMARLEAAGVPALTWSALGHQLLSTWTAEILPAPDAEIQAAWDFTLPPPALTSDGGSVSPTTTPATL